MSLEVVWKLFCGMNDGQDNFFQGEIPKFNLLEGFANIIYWLLDPLFNLYQDQTYCMRCKSYISIQDLFFWPEQDWRMS